MNYNKLNIIMDLISKLVIAIATIILSAFACYYVPPLYVLIASLLIMMALSNLGFKHNLVDTALHSATFVSLSATTVLVYCIMGGELNVMMTTSLDNFRFNLTNIPFTYLFTGSR